MLKKSLSVFVVLIVGVFGILALCNNPTTPTSTDITGKWSGITPVLSQGAYANDTFSCVLKINSGGTYSLLRGHIFYGSSGMQQDSAREAGTWTKLGTDSLVLTPHKEADSTKDSCFHYDGAMGQWYRCDGSPAAYYNTCPDPMHVKINVTNNEWSLTLVRYDDPNSSVNYVLKKQ